MTDDPEVPTDPEATQVFRDQGLPPDPVEPEGVLGRYELLRKLGEGGFSRVYKARDTATGNIVAIKALRSAISRHADNIERLKREFEATIALSHRNIIQAIEFGEEGFRGNWIHFLVMEFIDGWDLAAAMKELRTIPSRKARSIISDIASAVSFAHGRGFLHRDIKPHNILLPAEGVPKLSDFGLVKVFGAESALTRTGETLGTIAYMPPEQYRDAKSVTPACDIYSLAMTYLVMRTAKYPFESQHQSEWHSEKVAGLHITKQRYPEMPDRELAAIARALSPMPDQRHNSADQFVNELFA